MHVGLILKACVVCPNDSFWEGLSVSFALPPLDDPQEIPQWLLKSATSCPTAS
jgi:hypothetical protein